MPSGPSTTDAAAARRAGIPSLLAEVQTAALAFDTPAARLIARGEERLLRLADVEGLLSSQTLVVDACRRLVCYCGGGISATEGLFVLHRLGYDNLALYDASMAGGARDATLPIGRG